MSSEFDPALVLGEHHQKHYGAEVTFAGIIPEWNLKNEWLWSVIVELVDNCVTNRLPDSNEHATSVQVTFDKGRVIVEDNFSYKNPEEVVMKLKQYVASGKRNSTKQNPSGYGIICSQGVLTEHGGSLDYYIKGQTIGAVATYEEVPQIIN